MSAHGDSVTQMSEKLSEVHLSRIFFAFCFFFFSRLIFLSSTVNFVESQVEDKEKTRTSSETAASKNVSYSAEKVIGRGSFGVVFMAKVITISLIYAFLLFL